MFSLRGSIGKSPHPPGGKYQLMSFWGKKIRGEEKKGENVKEKGRKGKEKEKRGSKRVN